MRHQQQQAAGLSGAVLRAILPHKNFKLKNRPSISILAAD